MKIVALINARGGSKGIKNKNILKFKNTTLLGNSIFQAKKIKLIQRVFVSTDNKKIANQGGTIAGNTRKEIEAKTGKKVVSDLSAKQLLVSKTKRLDK